MRPSSVFQDHRTHFLLLSLFSFLILFVPLHRGDLSGYDDALYAHQAKEMIRSGDWWNVRFNGSLNFEYPPMFMWLEAISMSLLGFSDFAAKVPAALAGFGTILLVYFLARELTDEPWTPRLAMLVLVSTQYFMKYSTHAMTDVPFTFFFALAILLYLQGLRAPRYLALA
ncbi:MAG TPA: glycosyltransferase family 39 protein, partial [Anaerolineales bacterium]